MDDIDDQVESVNQWEDRQRRSTVVAAQTENSTSRVPIGTVEEFFDRINVAAISLTGTIKVGDIIEIGSDEEAIRQRISSMQINKKDVEVASEGDSVGIKLKFHVPVGSSVYKMK